MNIWFREEWGISGLDEKLLVSQERQCSLELVGYKIFVGYFSEGGRLKDEITNIELVCGVSFQILVHCVRFCPSWTNTNFPVHQVILNFLAHLFFSDESHFLLAFSYWIWAMAFHSVTLGLATFCRCHNACHLCFRPLSCMCDCKKCLVVKQ
jgi:hypothetical protein